MTDHFFMLSQMFNGATFGSSAALLWGIMDPAIMTILGDTSMFLLIAGIAGAGYATVEIFRLAVK